MIRVLLFICNKLIQQIIVMFLLWETSFQWDAQLLMQVFTRKKEQGNGID